MKKISYLFQKSIKKLMGINEEAASILSYTQKMYYLQRDKERRDILAGDKYSHQKNLNKYEFQVFSQCGQDGIIAEIFRRIGVTNKYFVEFGVGAGGGMQNNSMYLLIQEWSGLWIDGSKSHCLNIKNKLNNFLTSNKLVLENEYVMKENIESIFLKNAIPSEFDLLSIDIDGNDYYIWEAITNYNPRVVVIEYNSYFPSEVSWKVEYDPKRVWDESSIEFGASLKALTNLAISKGYVLVACELTGNDAFFVRKDCVSDLFQIPNTPTFLYEPMRYHLIETQGYARRISNFFGNVKSDVND